MFIQSLVNGVTGSLILILIASGLYLIFGIMHIVNFAHGEFFMLGGFGAWLFFTKHPLPFIESDHLRYIFSVMLSMTFVGLLGVVVEKYIFRPFRGDFQATIIAATGLMLILQSGALVSFGATDKVINSPFSGMVSLGAISLSSERLAAIICGVFFIIALYFFIVKTKVGRAMRAVAQDQEAALLQGINVNYIFSLSMAIGYALAAAGGALVGPIFYVNPYMGIAPIMKDNDKDKVNRLSAGLQQIVFRFQALEIAYERVVGHDPGLLETLSPLRKEMRERIQRVFKSWARFKQADALEDERVAMGKLARKLEERLDAQEKDESSPMDEEGAEALYALLGAFRGLLQAMVETQETVGGINWNQWAAARF